MAATPQVVHHGIVKTILSGDAVVIRGQPRGGPPPERTVCLSNVIAPRLARRPNAGAETSNVDAVDQPYAWEAREFMRKKLIGKEVAFTVEYKPPGSNREYGSIYVGKNTDGENMTESMVNEGLVELRRGGLKSNDEGGQRMIQLEETARSAGKGKWGPPEELAKHVRDVKWTVENPRQFVESHHGKPVDAVIEHVRDACTVRAFLLPSFQYVTVMLSGVKGPMFKMENDKPTPEPYAEEGKFFVESRLLQRDVKIILEGESQPNLLGTVMHPNGNISELLLREGFARCADWSMGVVSQGAATLREAEKVGKDKRARLWKDFKPSEGVNIKDKSYTAKVIEIVNGDSLIVKPTDGPAKKIFLASVRPPRPIDKSTDENAPPKKDNKTRSRPLYDVPYMFEAREFLRKKLIGKKVHVTVDYIQPTSNDYPEKTCATVTISNTNMAEALVGRGLATVVRYRQDDDRRSSQYDLLLSAEERAKKKQAGVHSKKEPPVIRVADISGDLAKSKQFLPFLQRAGRTEGIVEFVASGSRVRMYIPRETCLITFLLSGISCPRGARTLPGTGTPVEGEPFGEEAQHYTRDLVLQREVEVEVSSMDKGGNFIGWMFVDGLNLSVGLVEEGLSKVHFTAERSSFYNTLLEVEAKAKKEKKNIWANYEEPKEVVPENEPQERKVKYTTVLVTEITNELNFFAQNVDNGPQLEKLMEQLREEMEANPPLPGAFTPKKGELCAAKFVDGEWYRAKVERLEQGNKAKVLYMDYGNSETVDTTRMAALPSAFQSMSAQAKQYCLACVALPPDEDDKLNAVDALYNDVCNKQFLLNTEYKNGNVDCVTLSVPDSEEDVGRRLLSEGFLLAEKRREKRLATLSASYQKAQDTAKAGRLNLWRYGDFTEDDAKEFGYKK